MQLRDVLKRQLDKQTGEIDLLFWFGRTALELVGQGGLGHSLDPLTDDTENEYALAIKSFQLVDLFFMMYQIAYCDQHRAVMSPLSAYRAVLPFFFKIGSASFRRRVLELLPLKVAQRARQISDIITRCSKEIYDAKILALRQGDEAVSQQIAQGKDIMSQLRQYLP